MGGFLLKLIGGPNDGNTIWLPQLTPTIKTYVTGSVEGYIGAMKRGEVAELPPLEEQTCEYTLMPFFAADGAFLYMPFSNEED